MWPEVKTAKEENRRELKLSGAGARKRFEENSGQLDETIFQLSALNLLDVNDSPLDVISPKIADLKHLQSLLLFRNRIVEIPAEIGRLSALKVLDLSGNKIERVPGEIGQLKTLTTINLSGNLLKEADLSALEGLIIINLSSNQLERFPELPLSKLEVQHLSDINLEKNQIREIPAGLVKQNGLKTLNVAENKIELVPQFLVKCPRLKEINLKENPLKDKRLKKLVEQCRSKQVLDYVEKNGHVAPANASSSSNFAQEAESDEPKGPAEIRPKITVLKPADSARRVSFSPEAKQLRPHVLHCIVRDFTIGSMKKFLQLQNDLHDNECGKREFATIATHDLAKIKGDLRYQADLSEQIEITPLNGKSKVTAAKYYEDLRQQAEAIRKEKKRNTYSGVHKFINLLKGEVFVFFADEDKKVISLPPLTNCDETKVGPETRHLLLEVTSSVSAECARKVMLALLKGLLLLDVTVTRVAPEGKKKGGKGKAGGGSSRVVYDKNAELSVEQVRLFDGDGNFHSVFPGKGELEFGEDENIDVEFGGC
ncbi:leucine-rich repeat-containing protein 47-like [Culex pipiens pallens]|uniref:leucine-rich repeat-containing protein 47-like n=1 Tax=Culex pipiens pallens TaxID=42434 RepID=UPI001954DBA2|nr:leucine-rich repeat-containing protein 47-like [Culex pipiens pallens]